MKASGATALAVAATTVVATAVAAGPMTAAATEAAAAATARYSPHPRTAEQSDKPSSYSNGCHGTVEQTRPRACDYGNTKGRRRVLLLGDSQAAQLQPALHEFGRRNGVRVTVMTKSSCPAANVSIQVWKKNTAYRTCDSWHRAVIAGLRKHSFGRFDVAVISSFGDYKVVRPGTNRRLVTSARNTAWRDGTATILAELRRSARRVIVVRSSPTLRQSTMSCLIRRYPDGSGCTTPIAEALFPATWQAENAAVSRTAGATALDLSTPYCAGGVCRPVAGKYLAFRNSTHWGRTFSAKVLSIQLGTAVKQQMS